MGKAPAKDDKKTAPVAPAKGTPAPVAPAKGAPLRGGRGLAPEAPVEAVVEKKKEKKSQKERPHSKKKHTKVQVWKKYKIEGGKVTRLGENCPRCGTGTFLAKYKNRKYCGRCGWAQISQ
jgi:small subunit ribosomal protein S27Ae